MRIGYEAKRVYHNRSGLGNYSRNLINALSSFYPENEYWLYNPKRARISFGHDLENVTEKRPSFKNPLFVKIWRQRLLAERAQKDQIDIFHGLSQELPIGLNKRNIPSVVTVHDLIFMRYPKLYKRIDRNIYIQKVRSACRYADVIVAISEQTKNDLHEFLNVPLDMIQVIYQGCDPLYWEEPRDYELARIKEKYNLPERFVLFVGTLEQRKNVDKLVQVTQELEIPLVVVGRPTRFWKRFLKNFPGLKEQYLFTPTVNENRDLSSFYHLAEVFAYPSTFEGFGIPVLEALVSRTPVITSNKSSLTEVAGPSSLLVNPDEIAELREAIQKVWSSKELQEQMKESGYKFAQYFTDEKIAAKWQKLYQSLL